MGELKLKQALTPEDVAKILKKRVQWVWQETREGRIPKLPHTGRSFRYDPDVIQKMFFGSAEDTHK